MNGLVIYDGPSQWDDQPIVVIVTGIKNRSNNPKTGDMLQAWILLRDSHPHEGVVSGLDQSICGDCVHRRQEDGKRSCYVSMNAPGQIWKTYKAGKYDVATPREAGEVIASLPTYRRKIRLGAYGDPAMVPLEVWRDLTEHVTLSTGYTHQWRHMSSEYSEFCMASADNPTDVADATALGYRTFRCMSEGDPLLEKEIVCPASAEAGQLTQCSDCGLCSGSYTERSNSIPNVAITIHGRGAKYFDSGVSREERRHAEQVDQ